MFSFLKEDNGKLSNARVTIFLSLISYLGWATYLVYTSHIIYDMPTALAGMLVGLYGFNKSKINLGNGNNNK